MTKSLRPVRLSLQLFVCSSALLFASTALAQDSTTDSAPIPTALTAGLPDSPGALDPATTSSSVDPQRSTPAGQPPAAHQDPQQKRIFGVLPNFRAVSAGVVLPPQTIKNKFVTATQDSFDYSAFLLAAIVSGEAFLAKDTPEFHQGAVGYGRYYWHTFVDQTSEDYFVEFIVPAITHEDTRFYALGKGSGAHRAAYAFSRVFVTRNDAGKTTFNAGEIVGAAASSAISNLYYPRGERSIGNTAQKYGVNIGIDMASFFVKEFYPDIYHAIFHQHIAPATTP